MQARRHRDRPDRGESKDSRSINPAKGFEDELVWTSVVASLHSSASDPEARSHHTKTHTKTKTVSRQKTTSRDLQSDIMADDFDVEAMLEAPYKKEDDNYGNHTSSEGRDRDRDRGKDRSKRRSSRSRSKERRRDHRRGDRSDKDRDHSHRSGRDAERGGDRDRGGERHGKDKERSSRRSRSKERIVFRGRGRSWSRSPIRVKKKDFTPEERDARTVFCMQLAARIRPRDLEEFFSSVGKVNDVRLITDNKTRRSKGIAYVEFTEVDSVPLAMGLTGQRLLGVPILVQSAQKAEKNRQGAVSTQAQKGTAGPMRLYVGSLHFNITEEMLRGIFDPFGKIDDIKLMKNHETGRSQGYGFITFHSADDAKKALEQLNGFELAGRPMKVGHVTERTGESQGSSALDTDEMDRAGIDLGATGRLHLMAKLAEGTGFEIPQMAANALQMGGGPTGGMPGMPGQPQQPPQGPPPPGAMGAADPAAAAAAAAAAPPIATQCFMLSNMFDPATETSPTWDREIQDDVIEECNKHGGVLHIYVDKASPQGNVYVKCPSISAAVASVNALHGRYFAGKVITAAYVPLPNYHSLFPDAMRTNQLVLSSQQQALQQGGVPPVPAPGGMGAMGMMNPTFM